MLRRMSPRRNRWPGLAEYDRRVAALDQRRQELTTRAQELRDGIAAAETTDRERLAAWMLEQKGERPLPAAPELEDELCDVERELDALAIAVGQVLAEKHAYVERHRRRLVKDAETATREARERYEEKLEELVGLREGLVGAREATIFAATYGTPASIEAVPMGNLAGGLREPVKRTLGLDAQIGFAQVIAALREDAAVLPTLATREQAKAVAETTGGTIDDPREALWASDQRAREREKRQKQEAIARYRAKWGVEPSQWH